MRRVRELRNMGHTVCHLPTARKTAVGPDGRTALYRSGRHRPASDSPRGSASRRIMTSVRRRASVVVLCCAVAACGEPGTDADVPPISGGTEAVVLTVAPTSAWRELRIDGTTDLPDGAVLSYQVTHAAANELPPSEWPAQNLMSDGTAVVLDGQYGARINTTYWPKGSVRVEVQFPVATQPADINTRYGAFGEALMGDNVTILGSSQVVTAGETLDWTR